MGLSDAFAGYNYQGAFGNDLQSIASMAAGLARGRAAEEERKRQAALDAAMMAMKQQEMGLRERQVGQGDVELQHAGQRIELDRGELERNKENDAFGRTKFGADDAFRNKGLAQEAAEGAAGRASAEKIAAMRAAADRYQADHSATGGKPQLVQDVAGNFKWVYPPGSQGSVVDAGVVGAQGKAPAAQKSAFDENNASLAQVEHAIQLAGARPQSFGLSKMAGDMVNQRMDPDGVAARAVVADIGSLKIHDRSGAAVTAKEFPRLRPFIPSTLDDGTTVMTKLRLFQQHLQQIQKEIAEGNPNDPRVQRGQGGTADYGLQGGSTEPVAQDAQTYYNALRAQGKSPDEALAETEAKFGSSN